LIDESPQLGRMRLFPPPQRRHAFAKLVQREKAILESGKQTLNALSDAEDLGSQGLFTPLGRIGLARSRQSPLDLARNQLRVFEQPHDLLPNNLVKEILAYRATVANPVRASVRANAAIITSLPRG
jgi:hypothetical protein